MPKIDDLVRRATLEQISDETVATRTFRVSGLIDSGYNILFAALEFPGIPRIGDDYPGANAYNMVARRANVVPDGNGQDCLVVVEYSNKRGDSYNQIPPSGNDGDDVKQTSTRLAEYTTTRDRTDTPMTINVPASEGNKPTYLSKATQRRIVGTVVFERVETSPPTGRTRNMVGTTNSVGLPSAQPIYLPDVMLFTALDSRSVDGGRTWRVRYEFSYDTNGWQHRDRYTRADGKVPSDAVEQFWFLTDTNDFNTLGFDWSDDQTALP